MEEFRKTFKRPDLPSRCTWSLGTTEKSPHTLRSIVIERPKILPDILEAIGWNPIVRMHRIERKEGLECELLGKCEFMSPGGSVKDRIGIRMVQDAEDAGILKAGSTVIEHTSGNTGIGLALACAVRGYRCIIVMPMKMSGEKVRVLESLGAEIVRTPTEAAYDSPESLIAVAQRLQKEIPNSVILNQYTNCANPLAHYDRTAEEILWQTDGNVDVVVIGAGTGGTVTGIARKIKEKAPNCQIVAIDPIGSILAQPEELNKDGVLFYEVEGIGYDFIPTVLDRSVVDRWVKVSDKEAFCHARRLIREEAMLCGGSSGAALAVGLKIARDLKKGQRIVMILPDNVRNYLTKFLTDAWLEVRGFKEAENSHGVAWWDRKVNELKMAPLVSVHWEQTCSEVVDLVADAKLDHIGVVKDDRLVGFFSIQSLLGDFVAGKVQPNDPIGGKSLKERFCVVTETDSVGPVSRFFEQEGVVVVMNGEVKDIRPKVLDVKGVLTARQVLKFVGEFKN